VRINTNINKVRYKISINNITTYRFYYLALLYLGSYVRKEYSLLRLPTPI